MTYYTLDGEIVSRNAIAAAYKAGIARIVYTHGFNCTNSGLMLDSEDYDTRGECYQMLDESWTAKPSSLAQALAAAKSI